MIAQIYKDRSKRADLFHLGPPIANMELETWVDGKDFDVPTDLKEFWLQLGGGLFESETIPSPTVVAMSTTTSTV